MPDGTFQLALDSSFTKKPLGFSCKYLAVMGNSTGQATAFADSNWSAPIFLYPGYSGLVNAKDNIFIDSGSQPGKILNLAYSDVPLIVTGASKNALDPALPSLVVSNTINAPGSIDIVLAANNLRGVKIDTGIIAMIGGVGGGSHRLIDSTIGSIIANFQVAANSEDFRVVPSLYIPPGSGLRLLQNGAGTWSWYFNLEIL